MRKIVPVLASLALAACSPSVPDSGAGVGFESYDSYSARREATLRGAAPVRPPDPAPAPIAAAQLAVPPPEAGVPTARRPGISDEQSFDAVADRETIESDRERLAAQRAQYTFVEPDPLPEQRVETGPNIVAYALAAPNAVGESRFRRIGLGSEQRFLRNCARYASADLAQQAFLAAGGPDRDRLGLDPDGDGFACYWDPTPFRAAVNEG